MISYVITICDIIFVWQCGIWQGENCGGYTKRNYKGKSVNISLTYCMWWETYKIECGHGSLQCYISSQLSIVQSNICSHTMSVQLMPFQQWLVLAALSSMDRRPSAVCVYDCDVWTDRWSDVEAKVAWLAWMEWSQCLVNSAAKCHCLVPNHWCYHIGSGKSSLLVGFCG